MKAYFITDYYRTYGKNTCREVVCVERSNKRVCIHLKIVYKFTNKSTYLIMLYFFKYWIVKNNNSFIFMRGIKKNFHNFLQKIWNYFNKYIYKNTYIKLHCYISFFSQSLSSLKFRPRSFQVQKIFLQFHPFHTCITWMTFKKICVSSLKNVTL